MHTNEYKDSFMPLNWYVKVICALPYSVAGISLGFLVWRLQTDQKTLRMFMAFNNFPTLLYHASMLAFFAAFSLADSCIISILLNLFCLETANFVATWVSTFLLLMNVYPYALIISSMFASPLSTSVTSTVVYGLANVIASRYALAASSGLYKIAWSLLPSVAYALCIENLFADNGVLTNYYGYSVAYGWLFMIIDFGVILTIGIILDYILFSGNHDSKAEKLLKESDEQETMLSGEEGEKTGKVFVMYGNLCNINLLNKTARATNKTKYIVFKEGSMLDYLTVKEHFELYSAIVGDKYEEIKQEAEILAGRFELALDKKGKDLTRNQTKLAYIAITLAGGQNNKLLLIEEPTYGVDEKYHQMIYDLIAQIKRQQNEPTIFIATKNEYEAEVLADYLLIYSKRIMAKEWAVPKPYYILKVDTSTRTFAVNEKGAFKEALEELKEEEYSIFYKEGFNFPSKCTDRTFILEEEENSRTNNINNSLLLEKIWAVIWYSWIGTLRDLRMILFEFLIPFSAFALLLVISSYTPSNSYVYSLNDLPKDSTVPINVYTRYNESTEKLFNSDTGLGSLLKIETKHDKSTNIRQIAANFSNSLYFLSNTHASTYLGGYYVVDYNETTLQALIFGNITSPHIPTYFANILSNVYLRHITKNPSAKIITEVVPVDFHREANDQVHDFNIKYLFAIITAMTLLIPLLSMGYTVAKEQTALLRDFQLLNGLKGYEYWTGKALSDFLKLLVLACALIGLHEAFELHIPYFALIVLGSLLPCLLFVYFSALFSKSHSLFFMIAFIVNVCVVIPAGIMLPMIKISTILQQENAILWTILDFLGRLIPLYNLTGTLVCGVFNRLMLEEGHEYFESAFEFHFLGEWLFLLFLTLIGYSAALLLSPTTKQRQFTIAQSEFQQQAYRDVPYMEGKHLVHSGREIDLFKATHNLLFYRQKIALALVDANLIGSVEESTYNESMITGKYLQSIRRIEYCPKENVFFEKFSVEEHLNYYSALKGINKQFRKRLIEDLLGKLGLKGKKEQLAISLNPLNKRKLMVGIVALTNPDVLVLNEPAGKLDSKKRTKLWAAINRIANKIVFVSHSLEEVEKYSTNAGGMNGGVVSKYVGKLMGDKDEFMKKVHMPKEQPLIELSLTFKTVEGIPKTLEMLENYKIHYETINQRAKSIHLTIRQSSPSKILVVLEQLEGTIVSKYKMEFHNHINQCITRNLFIENKFSQRGFWANGAQLPFLPADWTNCSSNPINASGVLKALMSLLSSTTIAFTFGIAVQNLVTNLLNIAFTFSGTSANFSCAKPN
eukprot:TRINITY_DN1390_c0_g1_i1.p1 TRINITY_DN1390_c0_g1~~TRINITY_DN1390_c0_g1_i1.p1  ORF type:complete len:1297 (+),score=90.76 TRINITY_DN1390_c0_g1_i1:1673-5563(+)